MKNHRIILSLAIVLFISVASIIMITNSNQTVELTDDQRLFNELSAKSFGEFGSGKYLIKENYISKIAPDTKVADFIKELNEKAVVFENDKKVTSGIIKTGMTLKLNDLTFTLLVTGDLNNDGKLTQIDVNRLIRNIGKENIDETELILSDLNDDGLVNEADADLGADYLLGKSKLEFSGSSVLNANVNLVGAALGDGWYNTDISLVIPYFGYGYEYEVFGTKEISKTKAAATTTLTFNKNGAYLVNVYYYANDGNTKIYNYVFGIDYSRNRCNELGAETLSDCMLVNDDANYASVEEAKNGIKKKTTDLTQISTTDEGLLSIKDKDGDAFYYRGNVKDNFVEFAGYVWRIVRRNGDGSVRLVYNGTSTSSTGSNTQIETSAYGYSGMGFSDVGYRRNSSLKYSEINELSKVTFTSMSYTFADSYTCDESMNTCTLSGNMITGAYSNLYEKVYNGDETSGGKPYKYVILYSGKVSAISEIVEPVVENGVTNTSYAMAKRHFGMLKQQSPNVADSTIKTKVDSWYFSNLLNKTDEEGNKWRDYLADNYFCDEKSWGVAFGSSTNAYFKTYDRLKNSQPSLVCVNDTDMYTVKNGELKYPIGLITADEVALAGGKNGVTNTNYWLYTGQDYWTMSPGYIFFYSPIYHYRVNSSGYIELYYPMDNSSYASGVRPVINLSKDVLFVGGSGIAGDPYKVALSK